MGAFRACAVLCLVTKHWALGAFASRHLILQGCSPNAPEASDFWLSMRAGMEAGFAEDGLASLMEMEPFCQRALCTQCH